MTKPQPSQEKKPGAQDPPGTCAHLKADGTRCKAGVLSKPDPDGAVRCFFHSIDPSNQKKQKMNATIGRLAHMPEKIANLEEKREEKQRSALKKRLNADVDLTDPKQWAEVLNATAGALWAGEIDAKVVAAMASLLRIGAEKGQGHDETQADFWRALADDD